MIWKEWRVWLLVISLILAIYAIQPRIFRSGVEIKFINKDSPLRGYLEVRDVIFSANNIPVNSAEDLDRILSELNAGDMVFLRTSRGVMDIMSGNESGKAYLGIRVGGIPVSNVKTGLDLQGGVRLLLSPQPEPGVAITEDLTNQLINILQMRLNMYGLRDIRVLPAKINETWYIFAEVSGITQEEAQDLLTTQGKFEAMIMNQTVYTGKDIVMVFMDPERSRIYKLNGGYRFEFMVEVSREGAERFAEITDKLNVTTDPRTGQSYLNYPLEIYIDDQKVSELRIVSTLKGKPYTTPVITGGGRTVKEASEEMKRLETFFRYSLPVKIELSGMPTSIPPKLGVEFIQNAGIALLIAFFSVSAVLFLKYRSFKTTVLIMSTAIFELILTLGVAATIHWDIDLAAIAGLITAVGTGVNDQIIITDDILRGVKGVEVSLKRRAREAMLIIFRSAATVIFAMIPLAWLGFGLLRGFAITTTIGVLVGILITRPAYAKIVEKMY